MRVVFIGSGNVASHLALAMFNSGHEIVQVFSRHFSNAEDLAKQVKAKPINNILVLDSSADLYIISISDDAIEDIVDKIKVKGLVVHTSGSVDMETLSVASPNIGVFYPFQTFTKDVEVEMNTVPFCIEANNPENEYILTELAESISEKVFFVNSVEREKVHLSGVFACNFTNLMYSIAMDILKESEITTDVLKPLMLETLKKAYKNNPKDVQTGPAARGDLEIMNKHLRLLDHVEYKRIYKVLSNIIMESKGI